MMSGLAIHNLPARNTSSIMYVIIWQYLEYSRGKQRSEGQEVVSQRETPLVCSKSLQLPLQTKESSSSNSNKCAKM
jgi:hypothetical protein